MNTLKKIDYLPFLEACWQEHLQPKPDNAPTVISLFAGCGGSSLGYSMAGFRELLANEWDDNACQTFSLNFPDVPMINGDIAKLTIDEILRVTGLQPGELDILDGSPPCQGFSTAGKRQLDDPRNQLFREYVRILRGLKPKVFVMENVSGMVKGVMKLVFVEILKELKASEYKVSARLLNAMYFNVPQSRQRMIFIGVRDDLGIEPSHPKAESVPVILRDALLSVPDGLRMNNMFGKQKVIANQMKPGQSGADILGHGKWFTHRKFELDKCAKTIQREAWQFYHPDRSEPFSITELMRLFSYPDSFNLLGTWGEASSRLGNSVPPLFMRSIARHIKQEILKVTV